MDNILAEALGNFQQLLESTGHLREPMAMSLATAGANGRPSVRTVLLKKLDEQGLVFFTSTMSRKGQQLAENPYAAVCMYFQDEHQQVQVEGHIERVSAAEADAYWITRERASQIGAWASRQSEELPDRQLLLGRFARYEQKYEGCDVPRPDFWSGYRLLPDMIEFWKGHPDRLNQRQRYTSGAKYWFKQHIYP